MYKFFTLILLNIMLHAANANFLTNLLGLSSNKHSAHRNKKAVAAKEIDNSEKTYAQLCKLNTTSYGKQIVCTPPAIITNFKIDASATIRCQQQHQGISRQYPSQVFLSPAFLQTFNLCHGQIHGPNTLSTTAIELESTPEKHQPLAAISQSKQSNQLSTYYDIVCNKSFESSYYLSQQHNIYLTIQESIARCINASKAPNTKGFLYTFLIFVLIAIAAFAVIIFRGYQRKTKGNT